MTVYSRAQADTKSGSKLVLICRIPGVRRGLSGTHAGRRAGAARYEAEAAGGAKEGAGEPAQLQAGATVPG